MNKKYGKWIESLVLTVLGDCLYSLAVQLFVRPGKLLTGGTTGIGLAVEHFSGIPASVCVLVLNISLFILALLLLGKHFALTTLISTFVCPLSLGLFENLLAEVMLTTDPLLCTVFGGLGIGIGLGLVIRTGASTGGMDIPPFLLQKYLHIPVSVGIYLFDVCILLVQMLYSDMQLSLYGILLVCIYTMTLNRVMLLGKSRTEVKIISRHSSEICQAILTRLDRGVTLLYGEGGHSAQPTQVILSVVSNRELPRVQQLAEEIDPQCFMTVSRVSQVRGRGFSMDKEYTPFTSA